MLLAAISMIRAQRCRQWNESAVAGVRATINVIFLGPGGTLASTKSESHRQSVEQKKVPQYSVVNGTVIYAARIWRRYVDYGIVAIRTTATQIGLAYLHLSRTDVLRVITSRSLQSRLCGNTNGTNPAPSSTFT